MRVFWFRKILLVLIAMLVLALVSAGFALFMSNRQNSKVRLAGGSNFIQSPLPINRYNVFDTGVVDIDQNGFLDIFTVNHSAQQQFFLNDGLGNFTESTALESSFSQDHRFAFTEDTDTRPAVTAKSVSLYRLNRWLNIENQLNITASGSLSVGWPLDAHFAEQSDYSTLSLTSDNNTSTLSFSIAPGDILRVLGKGDIVELPHEVQFDSAVALADIRIGRQAIAPSTRSFFLSWRDRHAMAWTDIDNNGLLDAYISRGGVRGNISLLDSLLQDELFLQTAPGVFVDNYSQAGFIKGACPGREVDWVDVDNDGLTDLHVVCGRQLPNFPNQLWQQQPDGTFKEGAAMLSLDYANTSFGVWFDVDGNGYNDYLALQPDGLNLYSNSESVFTTKTLLPIFNISHYGDIALGDLDADGDINAFVASQDGSILLLNQEGELHVQTQLPNGLPAASVDASWVDFNADGLLDLHLVPQGVFLQTQSGTFDASGQMAYTADTELLVTAACSWFDADNNGVQDALCHFTHWPDRMQKLRNRLFAPHTPPLLETVELWKNQADANGQRSFDIIGPEGNPQAIGARLLFQTDDGRETASLVGQAEGARYSQGHYRVYYSPGDKALSSLTIEVPGQPPQSITSIPADVLRTLRVSDQGITVE